MIKSRLNPTIMRFFLLLYVFCGVLVFCRGFIHGLSRQFVFRIVKLDFAIPSTPNGIQLEHRKNTLIIGGPGRKLSSCGNMRLSGHEECADLVGGPQPLPLSGREEGDVVLFKVHKSVGKKRVGVIEQGSSGRLHIHLLKRDESQEASSNAGECVYVYIGCMY